MAEDEVARRFELLKLEVTAIQNGIRAYDTIIFQIKGWCVAVTLAVVGVAVTSRRPILLALAGGAVLVFYVLEAYYKSLQRVFIARDGAIEGALSKGSVEDAFGVHKLGTPQLASAFVSADARRLRILRDEIKALAKEMDNPHTYITYLLIAAMLGLAAVVVAVR